MDFVETTFTFVHLCDITTKWQYYQKDNQKEFSRLVLHFYTWKARVEYITDIPLVIQKII